MRTKGSSKFDADNWRIILGSIVFGNHSLELQTSLARMTEKLCSHVPMSCYKNLEALLASGCEKLEFLKQWFEEICRLCHFIEYYVNPIKIQLMVKSHKLEKAFWILTGTGIKITQMAGDT